VEKARKIIDKGSKKLKEDVKSGRKTISEAAGEIKKRKKDKTEDSKQAAKVVSIKYKEAFNAYREEIKRAKKLNWEHTSQERVREHLIELAKAAGLISKRK